MKLFGFFASNCPDHLVEPFGRAIGNIGWALSARYRRITLAGLRQAFGNEKTEEDIYHLAREVFWHFGRVFVEFFWANRASDEKINQLVEIDTSPLDEALKKGRGAILVTAHFGNWELLGRRLVNMGYPISVIARDSDDPTQTRIVNSIREGGGYRVISRGESAGQLLSLLKDNQLLAILPDQNTIDSPVFVPFFGKLASVAPGVGILTVRSGCPIIPGFAVRHKHGWKVNIYPTIEPPTEGDLREKIYRVSQQFTHVIEDQIRQNPEQWLWLHERWRKRPPEEEQALESDTEPEDKP